MSSTALTAIEQWPSTNLTVMKEKGYNNAGISADKPGKKIGEKAEL